ncbi:ATP-grasp ribosomal peptide maturase [Nonomuraea cavernae]|uniref:ATP-grasp ribosomal peptide maturase n=2 Tax=Nonomuraea cavernae TaxID=2045107 RepID=A0A918DRF4_9ACTN|nr:ATP-grasp ribosomal peptide maturase [Nonomuraea cavernae]GGO81072.1 ATP-grasp ribosomal peptide maturase [Nonomuraea cavernae]
MRPPRGAVMVITSAEDITANLVIEALIERDVRVARVDPAEIGDALSFGARMGAGREKWAGRLRTPSRDIELDDVRAVYYRRPTPFSARFAHLPVREAEFAAVEARHGLGGLLEDLYGAAYVNHPAAINRADFKPAQLRMAAQLGLAVPETLITNDVSQARKFAAEHGPIVYKSFRGVPREPADRVAAIWTQRVAEHELDDSISVTAHLFQKEVRKSADARVTVIGRQVFASRITAPADTLDWRGGDPDQIGYDPVEVPASIERALRAYLDRFGLVFGCFDFALEAVSDQWVFIECNPNGQWAWLPDSAAMAHAFADVLIGG